MRKVFIENLPKKEGIGANKGKEIVNWSKSIGYEINFIYDDIEDKFQIIEYDKAKSKLKLEYKEKTFEILTTSVLNGMIGRLIGKISDTYRLNIGDKIKDNKRDLVIIDRKIKKNKNGQNKRFYKYKCNNCGYDEGWIEEHNLLYGKGCSCCRGFVIVEGINDIPTTAPWMIKYFQGGYGKAKLYTYNSGQKIYPVCPDCGRVKDKLMSIDTIYRNHSIGCICGDNMKYPEKFMYYLLKQLKVEFITQYNKHNAEWCKGYRYDFYLTEFNTIIETHGNQHYRYTGFKRSLEEEKENDKNKKELALKNNINNYIVIDCRESNLKYIKNNILKSDLSKILNFKNINWIEIDEKSNSNLMKEICNYYEKHQTLTQREIAEKFKLSQQTIIRYLQKGEKLGWCNNVKERSRKAMSESAKKNFSKEIIVIELNEKFESCQECARQLTKRFDKTFRPGEISKVCNGKQKKHKGFTFKYVN